MLGWNEALIGETLAVPVGSNQLLDQGSWFMYFMLTKPDPACPDERDGHKDTTSRGNLNFVQGKFEGPVTSTGIRSTAKPQATRHFTCSWAC